MKKATIKDKAIVVRILVETFKNDPYMVWLMEESKRPDKLKTVMEYVVDETFRKGEIYLNDDNTATALWCSEIEEKLSLNYFSRNLFFPFKIGIKATISIIKRDKMVYSQYPKTGKFSRLYLIGVLPEGQGKGYASALINPLINEFAKKSIPVYLETANPRNVEIYKKKGFNVYNTIQNEKITIYFMKK